MSISAEEIFGSGEPEPATPGSYGVPPQGYRLPDATHLGRVRLQVADLSRSIDYYTEVIGFRVLAKDATTAALAAHRDDCVLLELEERKGTKLVPKRGRLGLYHFAILLPDRASLGLFIRHLRDAGVYFGQADHLVSEALYLNDPDGLGIEVYSDRPRSTWHRVGKQVMMAADPLDLDGLLKFAAVRRWPGLPAGTVIGHVHLHVGDLDRGAAFFGEGLGFDRMAWSYPGALFLGAGGYHHHLGTNIWAGAGALPPAEDEAKLLEWVIELPDADSVRAAGESVQSAGFRIEQAEGDVVTRDPWGTKIRLTVGRAGG
jgi:catechol 2,3-dioxygenase